MTLPAGAHPPLIYDDPDAPVDGGDVDIEPLGAVLRLENLHHNEEFFPALAFSPAPSFLLSCFNYIINHSILIFIQNH